MKKKNLPNKLTDEEHKLINIIISHHMDNMVKELNTVNTKNTFTGFENVGELVLSGISIALQDGHKISIKLDIFPDEEETNFYFNGVPINLN